MSESKRLTEEEKSYMVASESCTPEIYHRMRDLDAYAGELEAENAALKAEVEQLRLKVAGMINLPGRTDWP